jgi:hypothetical protein
MDLHMTRHREATNGVSATESGAAPSEARFSHRPSNGLKQFGAVLRNGTLDRRSGVAPGRKAYAMCTRTSHARTDGQGHA